MAGSFFSDCKHFEISGGEFNEIGGSMNVYHTTTVSATAGSHNFGAEGVAWAHGNTGHHSQFRPVPRNTYPRQQGAPGRTQTYSSTFTENPRVFSNENGSETAHGPQPFGFMRALPGLRTSRPGDEITAQIQREERARLAQARSQPGQDSYWSRPESRREATAPPSHIRAARPSLPIPMPRPDNSSRYNSGDVIFSSSPEDREAPSWPHSTSPPPQQSSRRAPNSQPWPPQTAPLHVPVARSSRTTPSDEYALDSSSDSEDEDMVPAPRTRRGDSQNGWISEAESR